MLLSAQPNWIHPAYTLVQRGSTSSLDPVIRNAVTSHIRSRSQKGTMAKDNHGGRKSIYSIITAMCMVLREACLFRRYAPMCVLNSPLAT